MFPSALKQANIKPVFKEGEKECNNNCRPVSTLSNVSKAFQGCLDYYYQNISADLEHRIVFCTCLTNGSAQWIMERYLDYCLETKVFDCLFHEVLIAKLHSYGFNFAALKFMHSYLTNGRQRTKINSSYSPLEEIFLGVPQGSIHGPLLFNIFLCYMSFLRSETESVMLTTIHHTLHLITSMISSKY